MTGDRCSVKLVFAVEMPLLRDGLAGLFAGWPHGAVHPAATLGAAVALLAEEPAILVLDTGLLGAAGPAAMQPLRRRFPSVRIVALAAQEGRDDVLQCLAAGAHGYVARSATPAELVRAIETVREGGVHVPAGLAAPPPPAAPAATALTGRQQEVLRLLAQGRSTKDIARTLDLAVSTIKVHLAAVYRTVGAHNRVEALCRAGVIP